MTPVPTTHSVATASEDLLKDDRPSPWAPPAASQDRAPDSGDRDEYPVSLEVISTLHFYFLAPVDRGAADYGSPYGYYEPGVDKGWWTVTPGRLDRAGQVILPVGDARVLAAHVEGTACVGPRWQGGSRNRPADALLLDCDIEGVPFEAIDDGVILRYLSLVDQALVNVCRLEGLELTPYYWSSGHRGFWVGIWFERCLPHAVLSALKQRLVEEVARATEDLTLRLKLCSSNLGANPCRMPGAVHAETGRRSRFLDLAGPLGFEEGLFALARNSQTDSVEAWFARLPAPPLKAALPSSKYLRGGRRLRLDAQGRPIWSSLGLPPAVEGVSNEELMRSGRLSDAVDDLAHLDLVDVHRGVDQPVVRALIAWVLEHCYTSGSAAKDRERQAHVRSAVAHYLGCLARGEQLPRRGEQLRLACGEMAEELASHLQLPAEVVHVFLCQLLVLWVTTGATSFSQNRMAEWCGWEVGRSSRRTIQAILGGICASYGPKDPERPLLRLVKKGWTGTWTVYDPLWENWHPAVAALWEGKRSRDVPEKEAPGRPRKTSSSVGLAGPQLARAA